MKKIWNDCPLCGCPLVEGDDAIMCVVNDNNVTYTRSHYYVRLSYYNLIIIETIIIDKYLIHRSMEGLRFFLSLKLNLVFETSHQIDFSKFNSADKIKKLLAIS